MKTILLSIALSVVFGAAASGGERPTTQSQQQVTTLTLPQMEVVVSYTGGDTLFVWLENESADRVHIKLLAEGVTLLSDRMVGEGKHQRAYILSELPVGNYEIQFKRGTYVVDNTIIKRTSTIAE